MRCLGCSKPQCMFQLKSISSLVLSPRSKAKNQRLRYCIYHPNIPDKSGNIRPPFDGELFVQSNDWKFYLGDTIWAPEHDKVGKWRMTLELKGKVIADKTFNVHLNNEEDKIAAFWKRRR